MVPGGRTGVEPGADAGRGRQDLLWTCRGSTSDFGGVLVDQPEAPEGLLFAVEMPIVVLVPADAVRAADLVYCLLLVHHHGVAGEPGGPPTSGPFVAQVMIGGGGVSEPNFLPHRVVRRQKERGPHAVGELQ